MKRRPAADVAAEINQPDFIHRIQLLLHDQLHADSLSNLSSGSSILDLPEFNGRTNITIYNSAVATYFAPSDISGISPYLVVYLFMLIGIRNLSCLVVIA